MRYAGFLTYDTGKLAGWRLRLSNFYLKQRTGIKNQAVEVLSQLETSGRDSTKIDDDLLEMMIYLIEKGEEKINDHYDGNYELVCICQQCDESAVIVNNAIPEVSSITHNDDKFGDKKTPRLGEIL